MSSLPPLQHVSANGYNLRSASKERTHLDSAGAEVAQKFATLARNPMNIFTCWKDGDDAFSNFLFYYVTARNHSREANVYVITTAEEIDYLLVHCGIDPTIVSGQMVQHRVDILRMGLLARYGGAWIDGTTLFNANVVRARIEEWLGKQYTFITPHRGGMQFILGEQFINGYYASDGSWHPFLSFPRDALRRLATAAPHFMFGAENWFLWAHPDSDLAEQWLVKSVNQLSSGRSLPELVIENLGWDTSREPEVKGFSASFEGYFWVSTVFASLFKGDHFDREAEHIDALAARTPIATFPKPFYKGNDVLMQFHFDFHNMCLHWPGYRQDGGPIIKKMVSSCRRAIKNNVWHKLVHLYSLSNTLPNDKETRIVLEKRLLAEFLERQAMRQPTYYDVQIIGDAVREEFNSA
tara:strand:- start:258 stop:1484 length:1227 start_codon:yes stop_codon:yes gene_type:complete